MSTHPRLALAGLALLSSALSGCGEERVQGFGDLTDPVAGEYVGHGPARLFPDGSAPIRLTLRHGEISFTASCNHFSGQATWDDTLRTGALGGTEMGCPGARQEQDEWMVRFFGSSPAFEMDGTDLVVRSRSSGVRFVPADEVSREVPGDPDEQVSHR